MKNKRNLFCLCVLFAVVLLPALAQAQFTFTTNNGALTITKHTGSGSAVTLPSATNGLPVVGIGVNAFLKCIGLTSITIPGSITNFGWPAFESCTNLLAVCLQGNAPVDYAPAAPPIFSNDTNATLYYLQGTTGWKGSLDTLLTVQWNPQALPELVYTTNNGTITVMGCTGAGGAVMIPSTINGWPVRCIGNIAFLNRSGLTGITLPNTVTNIGNLAFAGCTSLTNVAIPNWVPGSGMFSNCTTLASIILPGNATAIASSEFSSCTALASIQFPASITSIGGGAFQNCTNLNGVTFQGNPPAADTKTVEYAGACHDFNRNEPPLSYYDPAAIGGKGYMEWNADAANDSLTKVVAFLRETL